MKITFSPTRKRFEKLAHNASMGFLLLCLVMVFYIAMRSIPYLTWLECSQ